MKAKNIEGEVILHDTLEDAVETLLTNNDSKSALLGCVVYPDLHPFSWTDIIKLLFGNEFGILPDSFLLI